MLGALQVHELDEPAGRVLALPARHPSHLGPEDDVAQHRAPRKERVVLEHHARELAVAVCGGEADLAGGGRLQTRDDLEQGGLAAAGGPEEDQELAGLHVEGDGLERAHALAGAPDQPVLADVTEREEQAARRYSRKVRSTTRSIGTFSFTHPI